MFRRLPRWLRSVLWTLLAVVALGAVAELVCRTLVTPSPGATRFLFLHQMSLERWDYLLENGEEDAPVEAMAFDSVPSRERNKTWIEKPEDDRPPYDRIRNNFEVRTNAQGFRDRPFGPKRPGTRRILVLGDSISFGKGVAVEERFSSLVAAHAPAHVEILNLAYPACGTTCAAQIFDEQAALAPDLVVFQTSGNDVDTAMAIEARGAQPGMPSAPVRALLRLRSVQLLSYAIFGDAKTAQMGAAIDAARKVYGPRLDTFFQKAKARGVAVVVLGFPSSSGDIYAQHAIERCEAHRQDGCLGSVVVHFDEALAGEPAWVGETAELLNLPLEGLRALFPNAPYFLDIVHPNAAAHAVAAKQLSAFLATQWPGWAAP